MRMSSHAENTTQNNIFLVTFPLFVQSQVLIEGYDGQLPKLDMYYMLRVAARHASGVRVKPRAEHTQPRNLMQAMLAHIKVSAWVNLVHVKQGVTCCLHQGGVVSLLADVDDDDASKRLALHAC